MKKFSPLLGLALTFIFGCSSDDGDDSNVDPFGDGGSVVIGGKTWNTKNLDVDVSGSKCYNDDPDNCVKYGRLYSWAAAMALPLKCDSVLSTNTNCTITTPYHQGICPKGWHIPTNENWDFLYRFVDGTDSTSSPYDSPTAGRYLKAKEGWESCGPFGSGKKYSCEDTRGFEALPGGSGNSKGIFADKGRVGYWWSSSAPEASYAYFREIDYISDGARWHNNDKKALYSVRCVKDN